MRRYQHNYKVLNLTLFCMCYMLKPIIIPLRRTETFISDSLEKYLTKEAFFYLSPLFKKNVKIIRTPIISNESRQTL